MKWLMKRILLKCVFLQAIYTVQTNSQFADSLFFGSSLATQNPVVSMGCFSDYIMKSKTVGEGYSQDYNKCLLEAKSDRQAADGEMLVRRSDIVESSQEICKRFQICDSLNTTLDVFHCHALIGANNSKDVYSISGNASEYASILQENYRQIDLRHEQCCKISERKYVEATGGNYRELQSCLDGRIKPSSLNATTKIPTNLLNTTENNRIREAVSVSDTEIEPYPGNLDMTTSQSREDTTL